MGKITFKEVPYTGEEDDPYYNGLPADRCFEIFNDQTAIGLVYTSEDRITADGLECPFYVEWLEFYEPFIGQHFLRPTFETLYAQFGDVYFEGSLDASKYYKHIGCDSLGVDRWTGLPKFRFQGKTLMGGVQWA